MESASGRIVGLDVARGLAVIGMFAAHTLVLDPLDWSDAGSWGSVVSGRSAALFALLAGVSIALISGGTQPRTDLPLLQARMRILVRAVLLFAIGGVLASLGTAVWVILEYYAVLFAVALPFLRWSPRRLFVLAGVLAVVAPIVQLVLSTFLAQDPSFEPGTIVELVITGHYPAITWSVFLLVGMGIGRLDLMAAAVRVRLLVTGVALAVAGYGIGALSAELFPAPPETTGSFVATLDEVNWARVFDLSPLSTVDPHSGSTFEVVGATGVALAIVGLCLLVADRARILLLPIAATGSMPLTAYSGQIVALALIGSSYWVQGANNAALFLTLTIVTLVLCTLWATQLGRGPLEQLLTRVSNRAAEVPRLVASATKS